MKLCINRVILAGAIGRDGVEVRYNERGTAHASLCWCLPTWGRTAASMPPGYRVKSGAKAPKVLANSTLGNACASRASYAGRNAGSPGKR